MISDIDLRCFVYDGYGKAFVKKQKMSPDAWIQLAFQLTYYRYCACNKLPKANTVGADLASHAHVLSFSRARRVVVHGIYCIMLYVI